MKLNYYSPENTLIPRSETLISFGVKSGLFRISEAGCKMIGLKEGKKLQFVQDEDKLENWYLLLAKDRGFLLREKQKVTSGLFFNNSKLSLLISNSVGFKGDSGKIIIRKNSVKYEGKILWPLDLSPLKKK